MQQHSAVVVHINLTKMSECYHCVIIVFDLSVRTPMRKLVIICLIFVAYSLDCDAVDFVLSTDMILFSGPIIIGSSFEVRAYVCSHVGEWVSCHNIFFGILFNFFCWRYFV